jgi:hypothetical protein
VRFWRIKRQHLPGCPSSLNEYARNAEFTDLAFEASYGGVDEAEAPKIVFVASKAGTLLQVRDAFRAARSRGCPPESVFFWGSPRSTTRHGR